MDELKTVLVAIDGSPGAHTAIDAVRGLSWSSGGTIEILEVYEPFVLSTEVPAPDLEREIMDRIDRRLVEARASLANVPVSVETSLRRGRAPVEIAAEAERIGADLVALGSRGLGPVATMVLGSVAAEVVDRSSCPVLIARRPGIARIVIADDGSQAAARAVAFVTAARQLRGLPTRVVSVAPVHGVRGYGPIVHAPARQEYAESVESLRAIHRFIADEAARRLGAAGITADTEIRLGDPARELIDAALEYGADLIVMGSRGQRGLERLLVGSVARNVLTHAPMSVLIVPPAR